MLLASPFIEYTPWLTLHCNAILRFLPICEFPKLAIPAKQRGMHMSHGGDNRRQTEEDFELNLYSRIIHVDNVTCKQGWTFIMGTCYQLVPYDTHKLHMEVQNTLTSLNTTMLSTLEYLKQSLYVFLEHKRVETRKEGRVMDKVRTGNKCRYLQRLSSEEQIIWLDSHDCRVSKTVDPVLVGTVPDRDSACNLGPRIGEYCYMVASRIHTTPCLVPINLKPTQDTDRK